MINAITKKDYDPTQEFNNLWLNGKTGAIWIWNGKPIKLGFTKEGALVRADTLTTEFTFNPQRNNQANEHIFEYNRIPLMMVAITNPDGYKGSDIEILMGSKYGSLAPVSDRVIVTPTGNVSLGNNITVRCKPTSGSIGVTLYVISYE